MFLLFVWNGKSNIFLTFEPWNTNIRTFRALKFYIFSKVLFHIVCNERKGRNEKLNLKSSPISVDHLNINYNERYF